MRSKESSCVADSPLGAVYTPLRWAGFAIEKYGLLDEWLAGKTVFDPTMGEGHLLTALVETALSRGHRLSDLPVQNLFGLEINGESRKKALETFADRYGADMRSNFFLKDIFQFGNAKFDVLFGNPPWCNFADLPKEYKNTLKPLFFEYGLVADSKKLLLGGSRIDIAALVIQKTIVDNLEPEGKAVFFLPLSLFLNDGAHSAFRSFSAGGISYSLSSIYDFENLGVFEGIATRYGLALFTKTRGTEQPIPYFRCEGDTWKEYRAGVFKRGKPLLVSSGEDAPAAIPRIEVPLSAKPRQGINPCGSLSVFVFKEYEPVDEETCKVNGAYFLPRKYVYPLITSHNFRGEEKAAKWVLLPYNSHTGKPLSPEEMRGEALLLSYLMGHKAVLSARKGVLIGAYIKRGIFWALLGVGPYSFCRYKIVWEAYGKNTFTPRIFSGVWQANQSLQAFIPCDTHGAAVKIAHMLSEPAVERYLRAHRMEGTMNWAQPGKITSILHFN